MSTELPIAGCKLTCNSSLLNKAIVLLYLAIILVLFFTMIPKITVSWDSIGYVGSLYRMEHVPVKQAHAKTYSELKSMVSEADYQKLVGQDGGPDSSYRATVFNNPVSFDEQLRFYNIKALYVGLVLLISKTGVNPFQAAGLISLFSFLATAGLLLFWLTRYFSTGASFFLAFSIILFPPILSVAKSTTPDMLSAFFKLLALYCLCEKKSLSLFTLAAILSIVSRTESVITILILLAGAGLFTGMNKARIFLSGFISCAVYFFIQSASGNAGWHALFIHEFAGWLSFPLNGNYQVTPSIYLHALLSKTLYGIHYSHFYLFPLFIGLYILILQLRQINYGDFDKFQPGLNTIFFGAVLVSFLIKFLLFPVANDRYYIFEYIACYLFVYTACSRRLLPKREKAAGNEMYG